MQVRALESLTAKLPKVDAPLPQRAPRSNIRVRSLLDPRQIEALVDEYTAGATVRLLAENNKVSTSTVSKILKEHGVQTRLRSMTDAETDEAVRLYETGLSLERVGNRLGFTARTVHL